MTSTDFIKTIFIIFIVWVTIGEAVFALRHPWATQTERLFYIKEALLFEKVSYAESRNNYK